MRGLSSSGKSHLVDLVLKLFPEEAVTRLSTITDRGLDYGERGDLHHKILYVKETDGIPAAAVPTLRTLISEQELTRLVAPRDTDSWNSQKITPGGKCITCFVATTTKLQLGQLDYELETRVLNLYTDSSEEQRRRIAVANAERRMEISNPPKVDTGYWHDLQRRLAKGEAKVFVPYLRELGILLDVKDEVSNRRNEIIYSLIEAHALLHKQSRETDEAGAVIALHEDYNAVYALLDPLFRRKAEDDIDPEIIRTVRAVEKILASGKDYAIPKELAAKLKVSESTVSRTRLPKAKKGGYLKVDRTKKPHKITLGKSTVVHILPSPEELFASHVDNTVILD